jgi:hypothetical protein
MATIPFQPVPAAATVGSKIQAANWNTQVQLAEEFFRLNRPIAQIQQTVAQSIPNTTYTAITFTGESLDRDNQHDTATNTSRVVIGKTVGWYKVTGVVCYAAPSTATGGRGASIWFNGSPSTLGGNVFHSVVNTGAVHSVLTTVLVQATTPTDYVELYAYQQSGGALNTAISGGQVSYMIVEWIGS